MPAVESPLNGLPETDHVVSLLGDLMNYPQPGFRPDAGVSPAPAAARGGRAGGPGKIPPARRGRSLGSVSLGEFVLGVNWRDDPSFRSPFAPPAGSGDGPARSRPARIGGMPLGSFLAAVNWRDEPGREPIGQPAGSPAAEPSPASMMVETFVTGIAWD